MIKDELKENILFEIESINIIFKHNAELLYFKFKT
jgi:hypothetical protein